MTVISLIISICCSSVLNPPSIFSLQTTPLSIDKQLSSQAYYGENYWDKDVLEDKKLHPSDLPNLLTFWDFQEDAGSNRVSAGKYEYALEEMNGSIKRVKDGVFGPYSADFKMGQWFRIKHSEAPGLDIHGISKQVSMVAWIKRESNANWQFIAGMWDEGSLEFIGKSQGVGKGAPARQYAIFISGTWQNDYTTYERIKAEHQAHGYISSLGGATPDCMAAFDYATGGTHLKKNRWYMIAYTYDGEAIKVYVDGKLDYNETYNPFLFNGSIFDGGEKGSDFTVAQRHVPGWPSYPEGTNTKDIGFDGRIAGLAVYDRALSQDEINKLYNSTISNSSVKILFSGFIRI
jgi:hypothetical protein